MSFWPGKSVLVTGASSGIGRAVAVRLASLGAHVALAARDEAALAAVAAECPSSTVVPTDVTDPEQCRRAVTRAVEAFGGLDVVVCAAGVSMRDRFENVTPEAAARVMAVNFHGVLNTTLAALPHIRARRGSLVAISSLVGKRGSPTYSVYSASKAAVQGLYDSLRIELTPAGVHVGVVSPGHVATPLRDRVLRGDGRVWETPPPVPFRVWPVGMVVDRVVRLIERRRHEALLPGFMGALLALDRILGPWLGDWISRRQFAKASLPGGS